MSLKPWRDVAVPHPDVAAGRYRKAEFPDDLAQVLAGKAEPEYQDPAEFLPAHPSLWLGFCLNPERIMLKTGDTGKRAI